MFIHFPRLLSSFASSVYTCSTVHTRRSGCSDVCVLTVLRLGGTVAAFPTHCRPVHVTIVFDKAKRKADAIIIQTNDIWPLWTIRKGLFFCMKFLQAQLTSLSCAFQPLTAEFQNPLRPTWSPLRAAVFQYSTSAGSSADVLPAASCLSPCSPLQVRRSVVLQRSPPEQRMVKPSGPGSLWRRGLKETQQLWTRCRVSLFHQPPHPPRFFFLFPLGENSCKTPYYSLLFQFISPLGHCLISPTLAVSRSLHLTLTCLLVFTLTL